MMTSLRRFILPTYIGLCLVLGGASNGGVLANATLQLMGTFLLIWAFWYEPDAPPLRGTKWLSCLLLAGLCVGLAQFMPLPEGVWLLSEGRRQIASESAITGVTLSPLLVTLQPHATISALVATIPALACAAVMLRQTDWRETDFAAVVVVAMLASVIIGTAQLAEGQASALYFYEFTNRENTVGFFANRNHLGTLLLVSLPFTLALGIRLQRRLGLTTIATLMGVAAVSSIAVAGIVVNGSRFALAALPPTLLACSLMYWRERRLLILSAWVFPIAITIIIGWLLMSGSGSAYLSIETDGDVGSRAYLWAKTSEAAKDFWLLGSGLGTFAQTIRRYENEMVISSTYMNHAHNDYLQLFLEIGIIVLPLLGLFLIWWGTNATRAWLSRDPAPFARAATIASAVILVHSFVDYPLRTAALSTVFVTCLVLIASGPSYRAQLKQGPILQDHSWPYYPPNSSGSKRFRMQRETK